MEAFSYLGAHERGLRGGGRSRGVPKPRRPRRRFFSASQKRLSEFEPGPGPAVARPLVDEPYGVQAGDAAALFKAPCFEPRLRGRPCFPATRFEQVENVARRQRPAEQIALHLRAAFLPKMPKLLQGLDALRGRRHA